MEINHHKAASILDLGRVEIEPLIQKLALLTEKDWDTQEDFEANYNKGKGALNNTEHIIFKFSNKQVTPFEYFNCSRWEEWKNILMPILEQATLEYQYKNGFFTRVMLAKLPAKSFIFPHIDGNELGSIPHKIHIPIQTNEQTYFYVESIKYKLKAGWAYEVNNSVMHSAVNNGETDRIHLIFEYLDYNQQTETIKKQLEKVRTV